MTIRKLIDLLSVAVVALSAMLIISFSTTAAINDNVKALRQEVVAMHNAITVQQDSILVNVKTPVWWR